MGLAPPSFLSNASTLSRFYAASRRTGSRGTEYQPRNTRTTRKLSATLPRFYAFTLPRPLRGLDILFPPHDNYLEEAKEGRDSQPRPQAVPRRSFARTCVAAISMRVTSDQRRVTNPRPLAKRLGRPETAPRESRGDGDGRHTARSIWVVPWILTDFRAKWKGHHGEAKITDKAFCQSGVSSAVAIESGIIIESGDLCG